MSGIDFTTQKFNHCQVIARPGESRVCWPQDPFFNLEGSCASVVRSPSRSSTNSVRFSVRMQPSERRSRVIAFVAAVGCGPGTSSTTATSDTVTTGSTGSVTSAATATSAEATSTTTTSAEATSTDDGSTSTSTTSSTESSTGDGLIYCIAPGPGECPPGQCCQQDVPGLFICVDFGSSCSCQTDRDCPMGETCEPTGFKGELNCVGPGDSSSTG